MIAAIAGVGIATYTLLPALREQRNSQNQSYEEVKRTIASQEDSTQAATSTKSTK
ncbi:hypothetical protein H4218_004350 [Coemansia sp. IMI 209128]|nr:hypothetical protein H4218_004350 [Coemansia sp. IMI 209128]